MKLPTNPQNPPNKSTETITASAANAKFTFARFLFRATTRPRSGVESVVWRFYLCLSLFVCAEMKHTPITNEIFTKSQLRSIEECQKFVARLSMQTMAQESTARMFSGERNERWRPRPTDQPTYSLAGHCRLSELSNVASASSNVFHSWNMYIYSHLAFTFCSTICVHASRLSWYCAAHRQPQNSTGISSALFSSRTDTYHILSNEWRETSNNTKNPYYSYWSRMNVSIDPAALSTLYNVHWLTHAFVAVNKYESQNDDWHRQHKTDT